MEGSPLESAGPKTARRPKAGVRPSGFRDGVSTRPDLLEVVPQVSRSFFAEHRPMDRQIKVHRWTAWIPRLS
jgi:hypothetical protein